MCEYRSPLCAVAEKFLKKYYDQIEITDYDTLMATELLAWDSKTETSETGLQIVFESSGEITIGFYEIGMDRANEKELLKILKKIVKTR